LTIFSVSATSNLYGLVCVHVGARAVVAQHLLEAVHLRARLFTMTLQSLLERRMRSAPGHAQKRFSHLPFHTGELLQLGGVHVLEASDLHGGGSIFDPSKAQALFVRATTRQQMSGFGAEATKEET
jgi:hypothetical protein